MRPTSIARRRHERLLRELSRRKLRTTLTILGITIGIWALVVFSSMANKINSFVSSGSDYYVGKIIVSDASSGGIGVGVVPIDLAVADEIRSMPGVAAVDPQVQVPFEEVEFSAFGMPKIITAHVAGADDGLDSSAIDVAQGRLLVAGDEGSRVTVLGSDIARELGAGVGDTLDLRGVAFEVVGILQPTLSSPDTTAMVPLAAGQELFLDTLPPDPERGTGREQAGFPDHRLSRRRGGREGIGRQHRCTAGEASRR